MLFDPRDAMNPTDAELRAAITLNCADALACTPRLSTTQTRAIELVLRRLVSQEPLTLDDERDLLNALIRVGCLLNPPFEQTVVANA